MPTQRKTQRTKRSKAPNIKGTLEKTLRRLFTIWASAHLIYAKTKQNPGKTGPSSVFHGSKRKTRKAKKRRVKTRRK